MVVLVLRVAHGDAVGTTDWGGGLGGVAGGVVRAAAEVGGVLTTRVEVQVAEFGAIGGHHGIHNTPAFLQRSGSGRREGGGRGGWVCTYVSMQNTL